MKMIPNILPTGYSQLLVFSLLFRQGKSIEEISSAINSDYASTYMIVHRLIKKGLVETKRPVKYNRYKIYSLSEAGVEVKNFLNMAIDSPKE